MLNPTSVRGFISAHPAKWTALLLTLFAAQCLDLARSSGTTTDEPGHLIAGLNWWSSGSYHYKTHNLFFAQKWGAFPVYLAGAELPPLAASSYRFEPPNHIGETFLFGMGRDPVWTLGLARAMITVLGLGLGWSIYVVTRSIFDPAAALAALTLYTFSPPAVSLASLMTTDLAASLWLFVALAAYWRMIERLSLWATIAAGSSLGLLLLTKFSAAAYFPTISILLVWTLWRTPSSELRGKIRAWLIVHVACFAIAWATIWAFFGFTINPGMVSYDWNFGHGTYLQHLVDFLRRYHVLPDPYLHELGGLRMLLRTTYGYLNEQLNHGGRWFFFPVAILVKTPLPMLISLGLAAIASIRSFSLLRRSSSTAPGEDRTRMTRVAACWLGAAVFLGIAMRSDSNIGHRHIFPIYPLLFVLSGAGLVWLARTSSAGFYVAAGLLTVSAVEALTLHGRAHSYFNQIAGGPSAGYRWLADSSLAGASELPQLAKWEVAVRQREPGARFYLAQMTAFPAAYGSEAVPLCQASTPVEFREGYYIFDATALLCGPHPFTGPYRSELEQAFKAEREVVAGGSAFPTDRRSYTALATSRLAALCRLRPASERVGDGYFVYKLTATDLNRMLGSELPPDLPESPKRGYPRTLLQNRSTGPANFGGSALAQ